MMKRSVLLGLLLVLFAIVLVTCGKKAAPQPPIPILPQPAPDTAARQMGDLLIYSFNLSTLSTDYKTPADIEKVEIYRLKDLRLAAPGAQTQTAPTQTAQTQTAPQTQTQSQESQTQTQTQTQTKPAEVARVIPALEFDERAELLAEVEGDQIDAYLRDDYFTFTEKVNLAPESEDLKNWYHYGVIFHSKKGKKSLLPRLAAIFPEIVPKPPSSFTATVAEKSITFTWNPVTEDVAGRPIPPEKITYSIYRGTTANFSPKTPLSTAPLTTSTFSDAGFQFGQAYYYFVTANISTMSKENESSPSNVLLIFPQDTFPPSAPTELNVVATKAEMVLIWAPNPEDDIAGYNIYRSLQTGSEYQKINPELVLETTFNDNNVKPQQRYYYVITAVDRAPVPNESKYSAEVSETIRR